MRPFRQSSLVTKLYHRDGKQHFRQRHAQQNETLFVDGEDFVQIGEAFERANAVKRATLGNAELRLMNQRRLVDFAVDWIQNHRG